MRHEQLSVVVGLTILGIGFVAAFAIEVYAAITAQVWLYLLGILVVAAAWPLAYAVSHGLDRVHDRLRTPV